jgi:hypothetical protein
MTRQRKVTMPSWNDGTACVESRQPLRTTCSFRRSGAEVMNEQDDPARYRRGCVRPETTLCDIGEALYI